jgi:hypothetical protein
VKTIFNFRKLLSLWRFVRASGRVFRYKQQFLKLNLSFHTLSNRRQTWFNIDVHRIEGAHFACRMVLFSCKLEAFSKKTLPDF